MQKQIITRLRILPAFFVAGSLSRNGLFVLGQSLTMIVCLFLAYRLVIAHAGLERFGVWSLLLAGSAIMRLGDVSGGGALARFVAASHDNPERARDIVDTVMLTSLGLNAIFGLALWIAAPLALPLFVAPEFMAEAQALIPYVVVSLLLGALALAVASGIDGAQRADQRAIVIAIASLVFLGACALLVPQFGVIGFGAAYVLQQALMLGLGWLVLRRHVAGLGWLPHRWKRTVFVETTAYTLKLNAIGLAGWLFEPLAKFAFNHAGGPALVALYELASRLIVQIRGLAIAVATPLVPAFAARPSFHDPVFRTLLEKSTRLSTLAAVGATVATLLGAPAMSYVVLGHLSPELLIMNAALTVGWSLNMLIVPLYFAAQAFDIQRWNFASHAIIAASVLFGAMFLVPVPGAAGLVSMIVAGLAASTLTILVGNTSSLDARNLVRNNRWLLSAAAAAIILLCGIAGVLISLYA